MIHWDKIHDFGDALSAFGIGAGATALGIFTGGGAFTAALSGADFAGIMNSFSSGGLQGAKIGAIHAGAMISIFGPAFDPVYDNDAKTISGLNNMASYMNSVGNGFGKYAPVYRRGGLFDIAQQLFHSRRGFAFGRNLFVPNSRRGADVLGLNMFHREYTTLHETGHYYQMINSGWASVLGNSLFSGNYNMPGNVEYGAQLIALAYGYYWR